MAAEHPPYQENDTDAFAGPTHVLHSGGDGPHEVDLDMRDCDVVLTITVDSTHSRLLHLQNVRAETVAAARSAVNESLNRLRSADDRNGAFHPERWAHTMLEAWDEVHTGLRDHIEARAEELGLRFKWEHGGFSRETMRNTFSQPRYKVRVCKYGAVELTTGTRGVPPKRLRVPPEVERSVGNQDH